MKLGSLFSGRGGFETGAGFAGMETSWTCEIDSFLHHKLKRIVPNAQHYRDIRSVKNPPAVDIISAGFPCQDISISNQAGRKGIFGRCLGLQMKSSLATWYLKTVRSCSKKDLNMSFQTFPPSGIMRNGTVGALHTLATRISVRGCMWLPTPTAADGGKAGTYCSRRALLDYLRRGHQRRTIYDGWLAGLTDGEVMNLYREVMSFPISAAKLKPSETQLCLW
jgi:hypothetical protein